MKEFLKEWSEKYPKCFDKFKMNLFKYNLEICEDYIISFNSEYNIESFEMLSGIIERFFEYNNIYISITKYFNESTWKYNLHNNKFKNWVDDYAISETIIKKEECLKTAYLNAARLLEKELSNGL